MTERADGRVLGAAATARWAVAAVLVLLAAAVLVATLTGPVVTAPRAAPDLPAPPAAGPAFAPSNDTPTPGPTRRVVLGSDSPAWTWVLLGGMAVLAVLLAAFLLSLRRMLPRPDPVEPAKRPDAGSPSPAPPPDHLLAAADEGLALLAGSGDVSDAVIACWVRLEEAAAATGVPRHPASTPSEFTAGLLVAGVGREAEVRELLGLYHRARFGSAPLPDGAAERAVACLTAIRASAQERVVTP